MSVEPEQPDTLEEVLRRSSGGPGPPSGGCGGCARQQGWQRRQESGRTKLTPTFMIRSAAANRRPQQTNSRFCCIKTPTGRLRRHFPVMPVVMATRLQVDRAEEDARPCPRQPWTLRQTSDLQQMDGINLHSSSKPPPDLTNV